MIIFFEGPDKSGKTTIAREFCKTNSFQYFKHNSQKKCFKENLFKIDLEFSAVLLHDLLTQIKIDLVIDRNYASEYAYSRALERETNIDILRFLDDGYRILNACHIFCFKQDYSSYVDDCMKIENLKKVQLHYEQFYKTFTKCRYLFIDTTDENLNNQIQLIEDFLLG